MLLIKITLPSIRGNIIIFLRNVDLSRLKVIALEIKYIINDTTKI